MAMKNPFNARAHAEATRRGKAAARRPLAVVHAALDERAKAISMSLRVGVNIVIPISLIMEIAGQPVAKLRDMKNSPDGLYFFEVGEMVYVPGLLHDLFGERVDEFAGDTTECAPRTEKRAPRPTRAKKGARVSRTAA